MSYLPAGLPLPAPLRDGLDAPFWEGTAASELRVQRCPDCAAHQWPPEWICHRCLRFDPEWVAVEPSGRVHGWTRSWHPVHPLLQDAVPYVVVLVELPAAGGVRMVGNLLGDPRQEVRVGTPVEAVFERHDDAEPPMTLVQWRTVGRRPG